MKSHWFRALLGSLILPAIGCAGNGMTPAVKKGRESYTSGGRQIRVETFLPPGEGRHPAVLVLYGSGGVINGKGEMVSISRQLAAEGMSVYLVHYFNRTGTLFANDARIGRWITTWRDTVEDGVDYVAAHPRADASRIGMYGYSLGAYLSVSQAALDPRVTAVAERAGGIMDAVRGQEKRMPRLLILHGREDQRVPMRNARELERMSQRFGKPAEIHLYSDEPHVLSPEALADADRRAVQFLKRHLMVSEPAPLAATR
jgi:dipeptidyl aminopeptidase/acylaminoacyl peptidase